MLKAKYLKSLHWFIRLSLFLLLLAGFWFSLSYIPAKVLPERKVSNSERAGFIFRNEKWSGEVRITGDIWAFPGTTVTVEPGSKIIVAKEGDKFNLYWFPWDLKSGLNTGEASFGVLNGELFRDERQKISLNFAKFYAIGTKEQPIIFQSNGGVDESRFDFNNIYVGQGILSSIKFSNYRRLIIGNDVTVRDSYFKNIGECAVCIEYNSPTIAGNVFENAGREYIWILEGSPKINDNLFNNPSPVGIMVEPNKFGAPVIYHNNFEMSGKKAIQFLSGDENLGGAISLNDFTGGSTIMIPCDSRVKIIQNKIRGNLTLARSGNCVGSLTIGPNFWQTEDKQAILREKILGKESNFNVLIPFVLTSSPSGVGRRSY